MRVFKVRGKIWALALSGYALPPTLNTRGLRFLYWAGVILSRPVAWSGIPPVRLWYFWNTSEGDSKVGSGLGDCEQISGVYLSRAKSMLSRYQQSQRSWAAIPSAHNLYSGQFPNIYSQDLLSSAAHNSLVQLFEVLQLGQKTRNREQVPGRRGD